MNMNTKYIEDTCDKCARCGQLPVWDGKELQCRNCGAGEEAEKLHQSVTEWNKRQRNFDKILSIESFKEIMQAEIHAWKERHRKYKASGGAGPASVKVELIHILDYKAERLKEEGYIFPYSALFEVIETL